MIVVILIVISIVALVGAGPGSADDIREILEDAVRSA